MKLLLDTHAVIWCLGPSELLSPRSTAAIGDAESDVFVSAVSAMEIATKFRIGKLPQARRLVTNYHQMVDAAGFSLIPITSEHALKAGSLAIPHRDPFDRFLIAQALIDDLTLVSNEKLFDDFGVKRVW